MTRSLQRVVAAPLLAVLAVFGGCGSEEPAPRPSEGLPRLDSSSFRRALVEIRGEEFETFRQHADALTLDTLQDLSGQVQGMAATHPGLKGLVEAPPLDVLPSSPAEAAEPLESRLRRLAGQAWPALAGAQREGSLALFRAFAIAHSTDALSRALERLETPVQRLKAYAPPTSALDGDAPPPTLYHWLYAQQRRPLHHADPWDRRVAEHLLGQRAEWPEGTDASTLGVRRVLEEILGHPAILDGAIVAMATQGRPHPDPAQRAARDVLLRQYVELVVRHLRHVHGRVVIRLDQVILWAYDRVPGEDTPSPAAPSAQRSLVDLDGPQDAPSASPSRRVALIVGVGTYDDPAFASLPNPVADATELGEVLERVFGYEVQRLEDPRHDELLQAIQACLHLGLTEHDQFVFFFAGHGLYEPAPEDFGYLVMRDARHDDPLHAHCVAYHDLLPRLRRLRSHLLIMVDACYAGIAVEQGLSAQWRGGPTDGVYATAEPARLAARLLERRARKLLTSGGVEPVYDGNPGMNSPFAKRLLDLLYGAEREADGMCTFSELVVAVSDMAGTQPLSGGLPDDRAGSDFVFLRR